MISKNRLKLNNKGFSLLELIIVIAIMGVVTGVAAMSTGILGRGRVNSAVSRFQSDFSMARTNSMTKSAATPLIISLENGTYYIQVGEDGEKETLAGSSIEVSFSVYKDGSEEGKTFGQMASLCGSDGKVVFEFKRNGGLKPYSDDGGYISAVTIGGKTTYITFETGKYSTEKKQS